jgi:serine/threonine protein kinase
VSSTQIPDEAFLDAALQLGLLTRERVAEARRMQAAMKGMRIDASIQEVVARNGMLLPEQIRRIKRALGAQVDQIPGYRVEGKIGSGGMGAVYKARQLSVDRTVAIKVMSPALMKDRSFVARFMNEARAAAVLNHPNIISVYDAGEVDGMFYLVMELAEGRTLRDVLDEQGPLPEAKVREIARQMALALGAIHARHLMHRDIKPDNIMIDARGVAKLCDFGLARAQGEAVQSLTTTGMAVGTPLYMSPEQVQGRQTLDIRSDLYSLGATLFHVATGRPPFMADNPVATAMKHLTEPPPNPRSIRPELSPGLAALLLRLLEKEPVNRMQTPAELMRVLQGGGMRPPRPPPLSARLRRRIPLPDWALYAVAIAAGLGILSIPFLQSKPQPPPRPNPPPVEARTPGAPPPPPKEELRAREASLRMSAVALLAASDEYADWVKAEAEIAKIEAEFEGVDVAELREKAASKIAAARRAASDAEALFGRGRWAEALAAFEALRPGALDASTLAARIDECRGELDFERFDARLRELESAERWREIATAVQQAPDRLRRTAGFELRKAELAALGARVRRELLAQEALFRVRGSAGGDWEGFAEAAKEFESYGDTRTHAGAAAEVAKLKAERDALAQRGAEAQAEAAWNAAARAHREGRFDEAKRLASSFLERHVATEFYRAHRDAARELLEACDRAKKAARESEAKALIAEARRLRDAREWRKLDEALSKVEAFDDTDAAGSQKRALQEMRRACDRELEKLLTVALRDDFEKGPAGWIGTNDKGKSPALEEWKEAREGRRSLKATFFKAGGELGDGGGFVGRLTEGGVEPKAAEIRFWGKLLGADGNASTATALVGFVEAVDNRYVEVFAAKVELTRAWREYVLRVEELPCIFNWGGDGKLDLSNARGVGFLNGDASKTVTFAVDDFRLLKAR